MLQAGQTIRDVADALGLATNTVAYHRDNPPGPPKEIPDLRNTVGSVPTREAVAQLHARGLSGAAIARELGVTKGTVSYHLGRLGVPRDDRGARRYDWVAIKDFYDAGHSMRECQLAFGFSSETWHSAVKRGVLVPRSHRIPNEELFAAGTRRNRWHLKGRILADGLKDPNCAKCGLDSWRGAPLSLELHHINGDRNDNRLVNLEFVCPNCHSQTENFAGRNQRRAA
jgi:DNA-binding CsgD family transcriptional regulator